MAERVGKELIKREKGYLYYLGQGRVPLEDADQAEQVRAEGPGGYREDHPSRRVHVLPGQEGLHLPGEDEERL